MVRTLIKTINRIRIFHDTEGRKGRKYYVKTPDGRMLEEFARQSSAEKWARETKDFVRKR